MREVEPVMDTSHLELLRADEVARLVGRSKQAIRASVAAGTFPSPVKVGARGVAWRRTDLEAWIAALPAVVPSKKESEA